MNSAGTGDEVIVDPGSYGSPTTPLTTELQSAASNLDIHGRDTTTGAPSAVIYTSAGVGVGLFGTGQAISDVDIEDQPASVMNGYALLLDNTTVLGQRLVVRAGSNQVTACGLYRTATLDDALCEQQGTGFGIVTNAVGAGPDAITIRNVTAVSTSGDGIYTQSVTGRSVTFDVVNSIVRGGTFDIAAFESTTADTVTTSHSNYAKTNATGGATITDDGTSQVGPGDQTLAQLFVNPAAGDFREALGAQTIGAGATNPANGTLDFFGNPRVFDSGGACESTDIGADQFVPASAPAVVTGGASAIGETSATVAGTSNALGTEQLVAFDYGPAGPGGGPPASFSTSAPQCLALGDSPAPVGATLANLAPGTLYYYRVVATNGAGTTSPAFTQTFRTALPPPPVLSSASQTHKRWHDHGRGRTASKTTFRFTLSEAASVQLAFTQKASGRKVKGRCVAQSRHNTHSRKCTRVVTVYTLVTGGQAGPNSVRYKGQRFHGHKLAPGSYTVVLTAVDSFGQRSASKRLSFTIVVS